MSSKRGVGQGPAQGNEQFDAILATISAAKEIPEGVAQNGEIPVTADMNHTVSKASVAAGSMRTSPGADAVASKVRAVFTSVVRPGRLPPAPKDHQVRQTRAQDTPPAADAISLDEVAAFIRVKNGPGQPPLSAERPQRIAPQRAAPRYGRLIAGLAIAGLVIGSASGVLYTMLSRGWQAVPTSTAVQRTPSLKQVVRAGTSSPKTTPHPASRLPTARKAAVAAPPAGSEVVALKAPSDPATEPVQLASLLQRAQQLLQSGDIVGARGLLRPVVQAKNADAILLFARSYDPLVIDRLQSTNATADAQTAVRWYRIAATQGNADALRFHNALMQHIMQN